MEAAYLRVIGQGHLIVLSALYVVATESLKFAGMYSILIGPWGMAIALGSYSGNILIPIALFIGNRRHIGDITTVLFGRLE